MFTEPLSGKKRRQTLYQAFARIDRRNIHTGKQIDGTITPDVGLDLSRNML
jgi:hypothetical protein